MKRKLQLTFCALLVIVVMRAQPHSDIGYDKSSNSFTTLRYGYGKSVESIIYTGKDQTLIEINNYGMPTEITNSLATVSFTYAGTSNVNVTQTVNGQTKSDRVPLNSDKVLSYREEYNRFVKNPSTLEKMDNFLAGGGAKLIGSVLSAITDKLDNPIAACFEEALEVAKKTDRPIIPINTLEALKEAADFNLNVVDRAQNALTNAIFDNYNEWTQAWSEAVYKYQKQKYQEQKASNRMEEEWRVSMTATLMANGKTFEEAAQAIAKANQKRIPQSGTPATGKPKTNEVSKGTINNSQKGGDKGNKLDKGNEPSVDDNKTDKGKKPDQDYELPDFETKEGIISYIKLLANEKNSGLPSVINVKYNRYAIWDPLSYDLILNSDKKTYSMKDYSKYAGDAKPLGAVLEKPFVHLIIWWPGTKSEDKKVPIPKVVDNRDSKY